MTEIRCKKCNRLLLKAERGHNVIECKCTKCGFLNRISLDTLLTFGTVPDQKKFEEMVAQATQ